MEFRWINGKYTLINPDTGQNIHVSMSPDDEHYNDAILQDVHNLALETFGEGYILRESVTRKCVTVGFED